MEFLKSRNWSSNQIHSTQGTTRLDKNILICLPHFLNPLLSSIYKLLRSSIIPILLAKGFVPSWRLPLLPLVFFLCPLPLTSFKSLPQTPPPSKIEKEKGRNTEWNDQALQNSNLNEQNKFHLAHEYSNTGFHHKTYCPLLKYTIQKTKLSHVTLTEFTFSHRTWELVT